jgi:N6-L-threonylcarbamoyladenine synthase
MKILGIESSCDETAAAVVEDGTKILSSVVASSLEMHQKTGGIIPEVAAREQIKCIIPVIEEALQQAGGKFDAIAVTAGPGLVGSLLVGIETAKTLSAVWNVPIIPVNHLVGHLYANWLITNNQQPITHNSIPEFPALALVVSGGHTDLVLMKNHGQIEWIGGTRDDAAGECFDKAARLLELGYPGGPAISAAAAKLTTHNSQPTTKLPRPMINDNNFDFSFSGLKTAVLRETQKNLSEEQKLALAYDLQEAICDVLVTKTRKAVEKYQVKSLLLAGGVSANSRLREVFSSQIVNCKLYIPPLNFCTDNAAYIASAAFFNNFPIPWQKIKPNPNLTIDENLSQE